MMTGVKYALYSYVLLNRVKSAGVTEIRRDIAQSLHKNIIVFDLASV